MKHIFITLTIVIATLTLGSCKDFLGETVYTEYDPSELLKDQDGMNALLAGAYSYSRIVQYDARNYTFIFNEFSTDIAFETGGGLERQCVPFINFNWSVDNSLLNDFWGKMYAAVAASNSVLNVVDDLSSISEKDKLTAQGEARFIRGLSYYYLFNLFGTVPIITAPKGASPEEIEQIGKSTPRASLDSMVTYMVNDFEFAATHLPLDENPTGKATKGAALSMLTKLYMHEHNWAKAAATAKQVMDLNQYALATDYKNMFTVEGENNKEYILRAPCIAQERYANNYMAHTFPPNYPTRDNWANFGAQFRTYSAFYDTFEADDARREVFITNYVDKSGNNVELYRSPDGKLLDNVRSFKYQPDPNAVGESHGNDIVYLRYADILLCRAEALNELNGPNDEAITLINQVRERANAKPISLTDYASKEALRDFILAERGREFFTEGLRREDLIRHGKYISNAVARGKDAKDYQVLYPIPLRQIEANNRLKQNPGYEEVNKK